MKQFEIRKLLIVPLEKMFPSQETSFQGSSLLDLSTLEPIQRKKFSTGPLFIRASRELLLLCLVTELVILWNLRWQEAGQLGSLNV